MICTFFIIKTILSAKLIPMKRILPALAVLTFFNCLNAQKIFSSDINNFWTAYDSIQKIKAIKEKLKIYFLTKKLMD
jgi:hypothetical protein